MANLQNNTNKLNELLTLAQNLPEAGSDISDATAVADDIIQGKIAYGKYGKTVGNLAGGIHYMDTLSDPSWTKEGDIYIYQDVMYKPTSDPSVCLGTWVLHDVLTIPTETQMSLSYQSYDPAGGFGNNYTGFQVESNKLRFSRSGPECIAYDFSTHTWLQPDCKTIFVIEPFATESEVGIWLTANATYKGGWVQLYGEFEGPATIKPDAVIEGTTYYSGGKKVTGTMPRGTVELEKSAAHINDYSATPNVDITLSGQTISGATITDTKPSSGHYLTLTASSSALDGTTQVITPDITLRYVNDGYISGGWASHNNGSTLSPTVTIGEGRKTEYVTIPSGSCTIAGGGLTAGDGAASASVAQSNKFSLGTATTTKPTSGNYITATGSGSVTRAAVTDTHTAGYIPAQSATTKIASTAQSSNTKIVYYPVAASVVDTASGTAAATQILSGEKAWVNGSEITGTMTNQGTKTTTLNTSTTSYTIPAGYHSGSGKVSITTETKTATPSTSSQDITPSSGKVLSKVTVNAISTQTKSATPSTSAQDITPDSGKYLTKVTVAAIPNQKTSSDLTASGATVSVPAGYYTEPASKTISNGAYSASVALTPGAGSVNAVGTGVILTPASSKPTSGVYITTTGSGTVSATGTATIGTSGFIEAGSKNSSSASKKSNTATQYYTIPSNTTVYNYTPDPVIGLPAILRDTTVQYVGTPVVGSYYVMTNSTVEKSGYVAAGAKLYACALASAFGDATAADVRVGKTFTSSNGVKIAGTATDLSMVGNLTGTSWMLNETLSFPSKGVTYNVTGTYGNSQALKALSFTINAYNGQRYYNYLSYASGGGGGLYSTASGSGVWSDQNSRIINITGGTDVTNAALITWLKNNAVLVQSPVPQFEALDALCDWSTMVDSQSSLVVSVMNLHPTYYLNCTLNVYDRDSALVNTYDFKIGPNGDETYWSSVEDEGFMIEAGVGAKITNVRWTRT